MFGSTFCNLLFDCRTTASKEKWENLEGTFVLSDKPDRVVFYLEGPAPGVNILIESVFLWCHVSGPISISTLR